MSFAGDQVEVQGYVELKTTFVDENAGRMIMLKYIVNTSSAYNLLYHPHEDEVVLTRRKGNPDEGKPKDGAKMLREQSKQT